MSNKKPKNEEIPWIGAPTDEEASKYEGFVYLIEHKNSGRKYVGRKYFGRHLRKKVKGRTNRKRVKLTSDWRFYTSSSAKLKALIESEGVHSFTFTILHLCKTRQQTNYKEVEEQFLRDVLNKKLPSGEYEYFNDNIMSRYFKPKEVGTPEYEAKCNNISRALKEGYANGTVTHGLKGKVHPNRGKKLPQTGHQENCGRTWYNNGKTNLRLREDDEIPDGFTPGLLWHVGRKRASIPKYRYVTPAGTFDTAIAAGRALGISDTTIRAYCRDGKSGFFREVSTAWLK